MHTDRLGPPGPVLLRGLDSNALSATWRRFEPDRADAVRGEIANHYFWMVVFVVRRVMLGLPPLASREHVSSCAKAGLIAAIDAFDPASPQQFETLALAEIRGSVLNALSERGAIPYSFQWHREKAEQTLITNLGRTPTEDELKREAIASYSESAEMIPLPDATIVALDWLWSVSDIDANRMSMLESFPVKKAWRLRRDRSREQILDWLIGLMRASGPGSQNEARSSQPRDWIAEGMLGLDVFDQVLLWLFYYENMFVFDIGGLIELASGLTTRATGRAVLRLRANLSTLSDSPWDFIGEQERHPVFP